MTVAPEFAARPGMAQGTAQKIAPGLAPAAAIGAALRRSRMVGALKLLLPAVALGLLALVALWPQLPHTGIDRLGARYFGLPRIDLSDLRELRMVNARYSGIDKNHRPFTVTADTATQSPGRKDDLVSLEAPRADVTTEAGAWIAVSADTGTYRTETQVLDLFGRVNVLHDKGYEFRTDAARVFMNDGVAEGDSAVEGQGVFGNVVAEGFRILERGETVVFTGRSRLVLEPRAARAH